MLYNNNNNNPILKYPIPTVASVSFDNNSELSERTPKGTHTHCRRDVVLWY